jgi:hypothetical protein
MGLDMYLSKKSYVKQWSFQKKNHEVDVKYDGEDRLDIKPERVSEIVEEIMYWRKANHIHGWFVKNIQGGMDECQESHVKLDDLIELKDLCKKVLETKNTDLLPVTGGFFFGSKEVDDFYWEDTKATVYAIEGILAEKIPDGATAPSFYYQASW